ncbi:hypothetical protein [Bacillus sp. 03113]|uniref:hypothetical protein n=1 Tax=Bacillus sp. 03113 TaxID=2578211 RepID=UPI0011447B00|nr:hypothetical protein [Bacillus sp. 03113]
MAQETLYFSDNFFSAGRTEIFNDSKEKVGELDLSGILTSGIEVIDLEGNVKVSGKFPFFGLGWKIYNNQGTEIGILKGKFSFFSKKYEYHAYDREVFQIKSEAFSKQYMIYKNETEVVAKFDRISGFFSSPAYQLVHNEDDPSSEELIAVVMGVNAIEKRRRNSSASAAT